MTNAEARLTVDEVLLMANGVIRTPLQFRERLIKAIEEYTAAGKIGYNPEFGVWVERDAEAT